jgi:2-dehydro-3-deoxygluconokinase
VIARAMGRTVSCDLNYRRALCTIDQARPVMMRLAPFIDVLIANEEHARLLAEVTALLSRRGGLESRR